jgi:hypothetical protein
VRAGRIWVFHGRNEISTHMRSAESWTPGEPRWRREQPALVGTSANILAAVGPCVYSFGGEFIASNVSGTLRTSQVFDVRSPSWSRLRARVRTEPLDATGADSKHGTYGIAFRENGRTRIMAPGGACSTRSARFTSSHRRAAAEPATIRRSLARRRAPEPAS